MGATCFNPNDNDFTEKVKDLTNGGVDFAIDLAGVMLLWIRLQIIRYGAVVTAGLTPVNTEFSFNHSDLVAQEKSILGSYMGSCVPVRDVPRFLNLKQGRLPVEKLIDDKISFDQLNEGFDKLIWESYKTNTNPLVIKLFSSFIKNPLDFFEENQQRSIKLLILFEWLGLMISIKAQNLILSSSLKL